MQYRTEIIPEITESLKKEWEILWEKAENANIFNSYDWFRACLETYDIKDYEIHVCYRGDELVAILPLQQYTCFGVKVYGTFCKNRLVDTAFLMKNYDKKIFKSFFTSILNRKNIYLQKIDEEATTILKELFPQLLCSLMSVNPTIPLSGDLFANVSPSIISQVKKIIQKNADHLRFVTHSTNFSKHIETMLELQKSTTKRARSMDIFLDEENKKYYQNVAKFCSRFVRMSFIYFNDEPIAYEYGFLYRDTYTGEQIAFHKEFKKLNPGKLMIYYLMEYLKKMNIKYLDQGGGISSYKMLFTNEYRVLYNVYYSNNMFVMIWWKLVNKARRIRQIISPKKNTRDHEFLFKIFSKAK